MPGMQDKHITHDRGMVDEGHHGWARDAPGESSTRRGENVAREEGKEAGRYDTGAQGESQRPTGTSSARSHTGVDPQDPIDPDMPGRQPGDQGG